MRMSEPSVSRLGLQTRIQEFFLICIVQKMVQEKDLHAPSERILSQHERRTYKVDHILSLFYSPLQPIYTIGHHLE